MYKEHKLDILDPSKITTKDLWNLTYTLNQSSRNLGICKLKRKLHTVKDQ